MNAIQNLTKRGLGLLAGLALLLCAWVNAQDTYKKVTSIADLKDGKYIIVSEQSNVAMSDVKGTDSRNYVSVNITDGSISTQVATADNKNLPFEITLAKKDDGKFSLKDEVNAKYISYNLAEGATPDNLIHVSEEAFGWAITFDDNGVLTIASGVTDASNAMFEIMYNTTSKKEQFRCYPGNKQKVQLYKKEEASASCGKATNVQVTPTKNSASFTWTAPATAPAQGYKMTVAGKEHTIAAGTTTLSVSDLQPSTQYTYKLVSVCGENDESGEVAGTFTTEADPDMTTFTKVTSINDLDDNAVYLLVNESEKPKTTLTNYEKDYYNNYAKVIITDENKIHCFLSNTTTDSLPHELSIKKSGKSEVGDTAYVTIADPVMCGYFGMDSAENAINLQTITGNKTKWNLNFESNGDVTIHSDTLRDYYIQYNLSKNKYAAYTSKKQKIALYKAEAPTKTMLRTPTTVNMRTEDYVPMTMPVRVSGKNLTADVTLSCPAGNFKVEEASLTQESMAGVIGTAFNVTFNGRAAKDSVNITLTSGNLTRVIKVVAVADTAKCAKVSNVTADPEPQKVNLSWQIEAAPQIGYLIEVFNKADHSLVKSDTLKNPQSNDYELGNLQEEKTYAYHIITLCGAYSVSDTVKGEFTTTKEDGAPRMSVSSPGTNQVFTNKEVSFAYTVTNFKLGTTETDNGFMKYTITADFLSDAISDTCTALSFTKTFAKSGSYSVEFELVNQDKQSLNPQVKTTRAFSVNLPDVASIVFAPEAGEYTQDTVVRLTCATEGASIYYSLNSAAFAAYNTEGIRLSGVGTYTIKAWAVKDYMDTSAVVSKTYTIKNPEPDCQAPTNLKATVADKKLEVVLSWSGEVSQYRLVLLQGKDTLYNNELSAKTYTFSTILKEKTTYDWAVASVCSNKELKWTRGTAFTTPKITTSANEDELALQADIYPNPSTGEVFVELAENARMEIFTLAGKLIHRAELFAGKTELSLNQPGLYFIRLENARGVQVHKIVVR